MAKTLQERQQAALGPRARLADVRATITDTKAALTAAEGEREAHKIRSLDPALPTDDARAARHAAADAEHERDRQAAALESLEAKERALADAEAAADALARFHAVKEERDQLAAELQERLPALLSELVGFLERIEANDGRCAQANRKLPPDCQWLASAEAVARGVPPAFMGRGGHILRLTQMQIPELGEIGMAWPSLASRNGGVILPRF